MGLRSIKGKNNISQRKTSKIQANFIIFVN
jgi:hypothetical protein